MSCINCIVSGIGPFSLLLILRRISGQTSLAGKLFPSEKFQYNFHKGLLRSFSTLGGSFSSWSYCLDKFNHICLGTITYFY